MLKLLNGVDNPIINIDDFYIDELWSGLDELVFNVQISDPVYPSILEESIVEYEQPYLVKAIDGGSKTAKVKCQLNLDDLKKDMLLAYNNGSDTVAGTIEGVLPDGWTVMDHSYISNRRTIELEAGTPLDVIQECVDTYSVVIRYDVKRKQVHIWDPDSFEPLGAFADKDLNLKEINYKGKSSDFATRLYGYGKDGLSVASINGGKPYVEDFTYSDKIISVYWKDDRYTVTENLLEDMKKRLKKLAVPAISYSCSVVDLAKTNPELYGFQDFSLMQVVRLVDSDKKLMINHQVVQYRRYPFYPEKNVVTLSTVAPSVQRTVKQLQASMENPSSPFRRQMQAAIDNATERINLAEKGYVILPKDDDGNITEMLVMNTTDKETATKVWRWNMGGLGYSSNGYNGPFGTAITMDGAIVANYITVGTMSCDRIRGGSLILGGKDNGDGVFYLKNASGTNIVTMDNTGITAIGGKIGRWYITSTMLCNEKTIKGDGTTNNCGMGYNSDWAFWAGAGRFRVSDTGYLYAKNADITGKITATSGAIGGNTITSSGFETHGGSFVVGNDSYIAMRDYQGDLHGIIRPYDFNNNPNLCVNGMGNILYLGAFDTPNGIYAMEGMYYDNGNTYISSDRRLKSNIRRLSNKKSLDLINRLSPVSFRYKGKKETHKGFIAQEVMECVGSDWDVVTEYLHTDRKSGKQQTRYTLAYMEFTADIVGAIQELSRKVDELYGQARNSCAG